MIFVANDQSSASLDDLTYWRVLTDAGEIAAFIASGYADLGTASLFNATTLPTANDLCFVGGIIGTLYGGDGLTCASLTIAAIAGIAYTFEGAISEILDLSLTGNLVLGRSESFLPMLDNATGSVTGDVVCYYPATPSSLLYSGSLTTYDEPVPRTLYFGAAPSTLDDLENWYVDEGLTSLADSLPTEVDTCHLYINGYGNTNIIYGSLTCAVLHTYGEVYLPDEWSGYTITAAEVYVHASPANINGYLSGGVLFGYAGSTITSTDASTTIAINASYSSISMSGLGSTCISVCTDCTLSGDYSYFDYNAYNNVYASGEGCSINGTVSNEVVLSGSSSWFSGTCTYLTASGYACKADYGCNTTYTTLSGELSYAEYGSSCHSTLYLTGVNSYLASGANVFGDVYYDPNVTADPSGSGAYITGTIYTIS